MCQRVTTLMTRYFSIFPPHFRSCTLHNSINSIISICLFSRLDIKYRGLPISFSISFSSLIISMIFLRHTHAAMQFVLAFWPLETQSGGQEQDVISVTERDLVQGLRVSVLAPAPMDTFAKASKNHWP